MDKINKQLLSIRASSDIFDKILKMFDGRVIEVADLNPYKCGYQDKEHIYCNSKELIVRGRYLNYAVRKLVVPAEEDWRQIIVRLDSACEEIETVIDDINGPQAWTAMMKVLKKHYTKSEINAILTEHQEDENQLLQQQHFLAAPTINQIFIYENCSYYDINNAHGSALVEMFDKCKDELMNMYQHRKDNDGRNKKIFNYFVGMLCKKDYRKTYNWIVHRTTRILKSLMLEIKGSPRYINTDGIILNNIQHVRENSEKLGEFKREEGTLYVYRGVNYTILQFVRPDGSSFLKGSLPLTLRNHIDLTQGKVVSYRRVKVSHHYEYQDIKEIKING